MAARIAEQSKHSVVREPCRMGCWRGWRARLLDDRRDVVGDEGCLLGLRVIQETGVRHPVDRSVRGGGSPGANRKKSAVASGNAKVSPHVMVEAALILART